MTLLEARSLPVWGFPWQSNPWCRLVLGKQTVTSRRDDDTSRAGSHRAPVWNQEFQLLVESPSSQVSVPGGRWHERFPRSIMLRQLNESYKQELPLEDAQPNPAEMTTHRQPEGGTCACGQVLEVQVLDSQLTGRPEVGHVSLPLSRIPRDSTMTAWLPLQVGRCAPFPC